MDWPIQEIARLTGTTTRTLRHYDQIGLLPPSRTGEGGVRHYDQAALLRLQEILLFRRAGLPLGSIKGVLQEGLDPLQVLADHLQALEREQRQLRILMETVRNTIFRMEKGEPLMPEDLFQGFDNSQFEAEAVERWGREAYDRSNRAWQSMSLQEQADHQRKGMEIARELADAWQRQHEAGSSEAQTLAARHHAWVSLFHEYSRESYTGVAAMYRDDPRFAKYYDQYVSGDRTGYVSWLYDALAQYAEANLD